MPNKNVQGGFFSKINERPWTTIRNLREGKGEKVFKIAENLETIDGYSFKNFVSKMWKFVGNIGEVNGF